VLTVDCICLLADTIDGFKIATGGSPAATPLQGGNWLVVDGKRTLLDAV
jgi:hypothetical protein